MNEINIEYCRTTVLKTTVCNPQNGSGNIFPGLFQMSKKLIHFSELGHWYQLSYFSCYLTSSSIVQGSSGKGGWGSGGSWNSPHGRSLAMSIRVWGLHLGHGCHGCGHVAYYLKNDNCSEQLLLNNCGGIFHKYGLPLQTCGEFVSHCNKDYCTSQHFFIFFRFWWAFSMHIFFFNAKCKFIECLHLIKCHYFEQQLVVVIKFWPQT